MITLAIIMMKTDDYTLANVGDIDNNDRYNNNK